MCADMTQADSAKTRVAPTIIAVIVLACIPLVWRNDYIISLLTLILLYSLMAQSWNLTIGMCSIWNLGQLAIIAIGGYVTGILTVELGASAWLALPAGVVAGGLAAAIIVLPVIRLRGFFAALLTFAVAEVVRLLVLADGTGFTGGRFGLSGVPGLFDHLSYSGSLRASFWLTLVLSAAVMLLVRGMMDSPFGRGSWVVASPRWASTGAGRPLWRPSSPVSWPVSPAGCTPPTITASRRASWPSAPWASS